MTVLELKEWLNKLPINANGMNVGIAVQTPGGYVCPDGCLVDVDTIHEGFDWHMNDVILVPTVSLKIADIDEWKNHGKDAPYPG